MGPPTRNQEEAASGTSGHNAYDRGRSAGLVAEVQDDALDAALRTRPELKVERRMARLTNDKHCSGGGTSAGDAPQHLVEHLRGAGEQVRSEDEK